jgi:hypothetical protein
VKSLSNLFERKLLWILLGFAFLSTWLAGCTSLIAQPPQVIGEPLPTSQPAQQVLGAISARQVAGFVNKPAGAYVPVIGFGESVSISGDTLVVGASDWNSRNGKGEVFVYQYRLGEWVEQTRLLASDRDDGFQYDQNFGKSVSIYGDTIAVGAPKADDRQVGDNVGAVYIYERRGELWEETTILKASDARPKAGFGRFVQLSADTLIVSLDYGENSVYVYERSGDDWIEQARLSEGGSGSRDWFGPSIAIHGDWLAVGVFLDFQDERGWGTEAVYLYQRDGDEWNQVDTLSVLEEGTGFGSSLAMDTETLVVGAPGDKEAGFMAGAVYLYRLEGQIWRESGKIVAPDSTIMTGFGGFAAVQGDTLVVGAPGDDEHGLWAGSAYLYRREGDTWMVQDKLIPPDESKFGGFFGRPIAVDGDTIVIAAPDEFGNAVYVYEVERE